MENVFFHKMDHALLEKMKAELAAAEDQSALVAATGIEDTGVIRDLMEQGISVETLASVGLIPLIAVAWADGKMEEAERKAILKAARETGIDESHGSYELVSRWLEVQPDADLFASWKEYVGAMKQTLDAASISQIKKSVVQRAEEVANAAGGFMGMHKTSAVEQRVLDDLVAAFE